MKLYLVRHAESQGNATGNYSVATHDSLSERGRLQAERLAVYLAGKRYDRIMVSPLQRARETILPYLKSSNQVAEIWPEIAECCSQPVREVAASSWDRQPMELPDSAREWLRFREDKAVRPAAGETFGQGLCRVRETIQRVEDLAASGSRELSILFLTHGHFIREFLNLALESEPRQEFSHRNCAASELSFHGKWVLEHSDHVLLSNPN